MRFTLTITAGLVGLASLVSGQVVLPISQASSSASVPAVTTSVSATGSSPVPQPQPTTTISSFSAPASGITSSLIVTSSTTPPSIPTPAPGYVIHPNGVNGKCLDVRGAQLSNGTPVQIYECNGSTAQKWNIAYGEGQVRLAGTDFCLDAGSTPGNGVGMKIWQCYPGLAAQTWFYTADNRIALSGQGQCLDVPNGSLSNSNQVQTWQCTDNNTHQVWVLTNY